jgi:preprotein translocase subunit SecA
VIVDEYTGRPAAGRQWRDGLHQAVEAREGLEISLAGNTAAQITTQEFFALYPHLGGLTGTALSSAGELRRSYGLSVVTIPTNRPCLRRRLDDRIVNTASEKWEAIVDEVCAIQTTGRPVLVGTRSIDKSEALAERLAARGVVHRVLHARQLAEEAEIVARAGEPGAVTVATNMAGRGTDIALGRGVAHAGGLHIICSELHDAIRIDRQLAGRCARQGDPGSVRQYLSLDDEILDAAFGHDRAAQMRSGWRRSGAPLESRARWLYRAQRAVERRHRADRRLLIHNARLRRELHERLGQDPFLDSAMDE